MAFTTEGIKANLTGLATKWMVREGYEKGEAQTFLNDFFGCFSPELADQAEFETHQPTGGFVDCVIPGVAIIEMKSAKEVDRLEKHRPQVLKYWEGSADPETDTPAPPYVVLCAFRRFELWQPGKFPGAPRLVVDLDDLPAHFAAAFSFRASGACLLKTPVRSTVSVSPVSSTAWSITLRGRAPMISAGISSI